MTRLPALTPDFVWKLDNMHTLLDIERLGGLARMEGNPWRIQMRQVGRATAFTSTAVPTTYYNKVLGLGVAELGLVDELAKFIVDSGAATCRIDILPGDINEALADRLSTYGLRHVAFQAGFYGRAECDPASPAPAVSIRPVEGAADVDTFLEIFHAGWEMQHGTLPAFKSAMRHLADVPGWHLCLAMLDGAPRGVGVLFTRDGIGYLAEATTLKTHRNQGCEQAFIHYAIQHAQRLGCEVVCGQCDFASTSSRNFERLGLRLAYTKAVWTLRGNTRTGSVPQALLGEGEY